MIATPPNNETFNARVDELLARVEALAELAEMLRHYATGTPDRYAAAHGDVQALIADFKRFADVQHRDMVDQLTTSDVWRIERDLEDMMELNRKSQSKHHTKKNDHLRRALSGLRQDIRSMKK